jgi:hypothetical protein
VLCYSLWGLLQQYTLHTGAADVTTYVDRETQSGQPLTRAFCRVCGSKISATTPLNDAIVSVPAGVLESAGKDWAPHKEQFCGDKVGWVPDFPGLAERYKRGPGGEVVGALT